jgi:hypothetical protein
MQDATCSIKTPAVHHNWTLPNVAEANHHAEEAAAAASGSETVSLDQPDRQAVDVTLNAVASSLSRLALSTPDVSPPGLSSSLATTSGYGGWPNDSDLFQASGFLSTPSSGLPNLSMSTGSNGIGANSIRQPFSASSSQQQQQRRAITGHMPLSATDSFGINPSTNGAPSYTSWANQVPTLSWLQANRTGPVPTRFGPVHHGRSMSVQNINLTGNASAPSRKFGNQFLSRGGGIFGATPSMSNISVPGRTQFQPQADQFAGRYAGIDEKSILASLGQVIITVFDFVVLLRKSFKFVFTDSEILYLLGFSILS